jgi:hypothetical protein
MRILLLLAFFSVPAFSLTIQQQHFADEQAGNLRDELMQGDMVTLADKSDQALDAVVARAMVHLRKKGDYHFADQMESEWAEKYHGFLTRMVIAEEATHDIGDHAPLLQWLATLYDEVEGKLGVEICKLTHLSDIKTFNYTIPIVFHPATFPMDQVTGPRAYEYLRHCNQGSVYYGLLPVLTYWVADVGCMVGTYGTGAIMLCGLIGDASEVVMSKFFAVGICEWIYTKSGGQ